MLISYTSFIYVKKGAMKKIIYGKSVQLEHDFCSEITKT